MRFSTKCWSEHILSAYKATKDLKYPLYMTFKKRHTHEPPHDKTNKMACAPNKDLDQPGHLPSLISLSCDLNG